MELPNKPRFFTLISKDSSCAEENTLKRAYEEFAIDILKTLREEPDMYSVSFVLSFNYAELVSIKEDTGSKIKYEMTKKALVFIKTQIDFIRRLQLHEVNREQSNSADTAGEQSPVYWSGSPTDLVELAYAIIESKSFNNGDININTLVDYFCDIFNVKISNCYSIFREIRKRTQSKTLYIDELKLRLEKRIDDLENGVIRKVYRTKSRGK